MSSRQRLAFIACSNATILGAPPLVTSNKARAQHNLEPRSNSDGTSARYDVLRAQRLAAPAIVYIEQFSAHPLERDAAELYGPPDGYIGSDGNFQPEQRHQDDKPVYRIELRPEDGLYELPYMAMQANGSPWELEGSAAAATPECTRQVFFPDGSRLLEEIERFCIGPEGWGGLVPTDIAIDHFRVAPSGGYTKGLPENERTDIGEGDIPAEKPGTDYFPYRPQQVASHPTRQSLIQITNVTQKILETGSYDGVILAQGSPRIEETLYWLGLLIDTDRPICGIAAHRPHGSVGADGARNVVDAIKLITSGIWSDGQGGNRIGTVLLDQQRIYSARDVQKADAYPGGYITTGGHGGVLGSLSYTGTFVVSYLPTARQAKNSALNITQMPTCVAAAYRPEGASQITHKLLPVRLEDGSLSEQSLPAVSIIKDGNYYEDEPPCDIESQVDIVAIVEKRLRAGELAGIVMEGLSPYGTSTSLSRAKALTWSVFCGLPVVQVGRGNNEGICPPTDLFIGGGNLTATKARLLLMATLLRFGSLPAARDPMNPTSAERDATRESLRAFQQIFDSH